MYQVADMSTKTPIVNARTVKEGLQIIRDFEEDDRRNNNYTYHYYDIITKDGKSVLEK